MRCFIFLRWMLKAGSLFLELPFEFDAAVGRKVSQCPARLGPSLKAGPLAQSHGPFNCRPSPTMRASSRAEDPTAPCMSARFSPRDLKMFSHDGQDTEPRLTLLAPCRVALHGWCQKDWCMWLNSMPIQALVKKVQSSHQLG